MKPLAHWFHRRSLTFATIALLFGIYAFGHALGFAFRMRPPSVSFGLWTVSIFVLAGTLCIHATVNLIRDVDRGYSPARCSLAAVILLFAFVLTTFTGLALANFILNAKAG